MSDKLNRVECYVRDRSKVKTKDILRDVFGVPVERQRQAQAIEVGSYMRRLGWVSGTIRVGDKTMYGWTKPVDELV